MAVSANRLELLQIADAVAREKAIDRGIVIAAMEDAIAKAARSRYGSETEVQRRDQPEDRRAAAVAPHAGRRAGRESRRRRSTVEDARRQNPAAQVGDSIADTLPPLEYGRIAAQSAKQVIVQKVREAERDRQYQEYKDRIGDIVNGIVKRVEYGNVVVDLGRGEAIIRRDEMLPREMFRNGDRVRAYIYDVRREAARPADLPVAHASAVHGEAVRPGSAGNLRRHRRGEGGRPRSGLARQDRRDLARFLGRSGRRLRRHARLARAGRGQRAAGREDRHHSVVARRRDLRRQRAGARPKSPRSCSTKSASASRSSCPISSSRSRSAAAARTCASPRSSPAGTSTSSPSRKSPSAARPSSRSAPRCSWRRSTSTRWSASCSPSEGFASVEELAYVEEKELAVDRRLRRGHRARDAGPRPRVSRADRGRARRTPQGARRRRRAAGRFRASPPRMLVALGENDDQDGRGPRRLRHRRSRRLERAQGRRDCPACRAPSKASR